MSKLAYVFGLIGSIIIVASAFILGLINLTMMLLSGLFSLSGEAIPPVVPLYLISIVITGVLGIISLIYTLKAKKGHRIAYYIVLIIGVFAAIGAYIPMFPATTYDLGGGTTYPSPTIFLISSLVYIEPYFLVNSGIVGLISPKIEYTPEPEDYSLKIEN